VRSRSKACANSGRSGKSFIPSFGHQGHKEIQTSPTLVSLVSFVVTQRCYTKTELL
jgi:hypothetical protein